MPTRSGRWYSLLSGRDADLDTSLEEYGFAWVDDPEEEEIEFFYGLEQDEQGTYIRFDNGTLRRDLDPRKEWDWVEWEEVVSYTGSTVEDFLKQDLKWIVYDLVQYYGHENIFGATNWGAWYWNKNLQRFQTVTMKEAQEHGRYKRMMKRNS
jgi:hypothetical protein